jgi:hypothetical protein
VSRLASLDELAALVRQLGDQARLYIRWTRDVDADLQQEVSRDWLSGVELPGLSANGLTVEPWWGHRPLNVWLARKLYDYRHLPRVHGEGTTPWLLTGVESGRGPDNEPLIRCCRLIAEILPAVIDEAARVVDDLPGDWGTLNREQS